MKKENRLRLAAEQLSIPLPLPIVKGNKDYNERKDLLERLDKLLVDSGIERAMQERALAEAERDSPKPLRDRDRLQIQLGTSQALRCQIARVLSMESFRSFAFHVGESHLLQKFCRVIEFDQVRVPSKSRLQVYSEMFDESEIRGLVNRLNGIVQTDAPKVGLAGNMDLSAAFLDSTCIELNIHFPVDWVLLRDASRTLTKAMACIRRHGLVHRMKEPVEFLTQMNRYCIAMTHAKKGEKARKERKRLLRLMKKLAKCVGGHAKRYRDLLKAGWKETDLSEKEALQIIGRIENVLTQLPDAIAQAHERIIGERQVPNERKILSLYESHAQVYHRGKAGAQTEFGLQLVVGEAVDGLVTDWELVDGAPKNDTLHLVPCMERLEAAGIRIVNAITDRGFASAKNSRTLGEKKIGDHLCPRKVIDLKARLQEKEFVAFQKRRAQTEGRIGILKHCFIGATMPVKGFDRQKKHMAWSVLAHNLWLIARRLQDQAALKQAA